MATKVEISFNLAANGIGDLFTLDDATKGVLNNSTYKLAGDQYVDVTDRVRNITISRGRSRVLEQFTAGIATVILDNRTRLFDPTYAAGPYFGSIVPRKAIRIERDGIPIFYGNVEDWTWDNTLSGDATATVKAVDGFASIAQATMTAGTATGTTPGARIAAALTDAGWSSSQRNLATGQATLDSDVIASGTNVTSYIGKVERSEQGAFFFTAENIATFRSRAQTQDPTSSDVTFSATEIPFVQYQAASLTDELRNSVAVTFTAGTVIAGTATATNQTSITNYGQLDYSLETVLSTNVQAQAVADYLVAQYKDPKYRVDTLTVLLEALSQSQRNQVLTLEVTDIVDVDVALPNVNPVGAALTRVLAVDRIEHAIDPARHYVSLTMSDATTGFVLDDAQFGLLNSSRLGF